MGTCRMVIAGKDSNAGFVVVANLHCYFRSDVHLFEVSSTLVLFELKPTNLKKDYVQQFCKQMNWFVRMSSFSLPGS